MWRCVKIGLVCCCLVEREGKKYESVCVSVGVVGGVKYFKYQVYLRVC